MSLGKVKANSSGVLIQKKSLAGTARCWAAVFGVIFSSQALSMPGYDLTYGDWKQMCGQPNQACNFFLKGFLQSAPFWAEWIEEAASLRPDLKNAEKIVGWVSVPQDNGQLCLPRNIRFESVRFSVNQSLEQLYREQPDFTPAPSTLLTGPGLRVNLYDAFKRSYPCQYSK